VAFGYFEALIQHGDANRIAVEQARLTSMSNIMAQAGCEMMIMEDFSDMTFDLLRELGSAVSKGEDAGALLMEKFNDDTVQIYIITHLKVRCSSLGHAHVHKLTAWLQNLTASWMKTREEEYAPYLIGNTVSQYCDAQILPSYAEIDNVALSALKDVLLSPAGMRLEVLYLDRSEGSEVTMHRFDPIDGSFPIGNVRVLYRP
jgi:ubiquitin thioesterase protein OTUB1